MLIAIIFCLLQGSHHNSHHAATLKSPPVVLQDVQPQLALQLYLPRSAHVSACSNNSPFARTRLHQQTQTRLICGPAACAKHALCKPQASSHLLPEG